MRLSCVVLLLAAAWLVPPPGDCLAAPAAPAADAQAEVENARRAHAFVRTIMSPFCPGRTLTDCPSPDATALRKEIRVLLDSGVSQDAILVDLERRYGDAIVGVPRSAWGWTLPVLVLLAGAAALFAALRSLSGRSSRASVPSAEPAGDSPASAAAGTGSDLADDLDAEIESQGL